MDMFPLLRGESISFESYSSNCHAQTGCANLFSQPKVAPAAELFVSIFNSFEAGIANTISSFKWNERKIILSMKNRHLPN